MRSAAIVLLAVSNAVTTGVLAHESVVGHAHPHEHVIDYALLGYDTLALMAAALAVGVGAGVVLARRRK